MHFNENKSYNTITKNYVYRNRDDISMIQMRVLKNEYIHKTTNIIIIHAVFNRFLKKLYLHLKIMVR